MKSVREVQPLPENKLFLVFDSGEKRIADLTQLLEKPLFSFLKNESFWKQVYIEYGAVTWKNESGYEVDICPDKLYMDSVPA